MLYCIEITFDFISMNFKDLNFLQVFIIESSKLIYNNFLLLLDYIIHQQVFQHSVKMDKSFTMKSPKEYTPCIKCRASIKRSMSHITCFGCNQLCHSDFNCAGFQYSATEIVRINKVNSGLYWLCESCRKKFQTLHLSTEAIIESKVREATEEKNTTISSLKIDLDNSQARNVNLLARYKELQLKYELALVESEKQVEIKQSPDNINKLLTEKEETISYLTDQLKTKSEEYALSIAELQTQLHKFTSQNPQKRSRSVLNEDTPDEETMNQIIKLTTAVINFNQNISDSVLKMDLKNLEFHGQSLAAMDKISNKIGQSLPSTSQSRSRQFDR